MSNWGWWGALAVLLGGTAELRAQIFFPPLVPQPLPAAPAYSIRGPGLAFQYTGRRLQVAGFVGEPVITAYYNPYNPFGPPPILPVAFGYPGAMDTRIIVHYVTPPVYVTPRLYLGGNRVDDEIAGVDLDLVPAKKVQLARVGEPAPREAKVNPQVAEAPRKPLRPENPPRARIPWPDPPRQKPKAPDLPPQLDPAGEYARLVDLGAQAFQNQEYGLAALRFRQATEVDPALARAHFLLAQANLAIGKYLEAVQAIEAGVRRNPNWPRMAFQPRADLYKGQEADFDRHVKRLHQVLDKNAAKADFLFLAAYVAWFDGRKAEAVPLLQQARPLVVDTAAIDAFLRAAPGLVAEK